MEAVFCKDSIDDLIKFRMAFDTYKDITYIYCALGESFPTTGLIPSLVRFLEKRGYVSTKEIGQKGILVKPTFDIQGDTIIFCRSQCFRSDCGCCKNMRLM